MALLQVLSCHLTECIEENVKRVVIAQAETRSEHRPNTSSRFNHLCQC